MLCVVCGNEITDPTRTKRCSAACAAIDDRKYHRSEKRRAYYRAYYAMNRDRRNGENLARYHNNPIRKYRSPETKLIRKITHQWHVSADEARRWIEQGSFPK
jgi:predicted nucleic acid-binding Zn ribbon protein